MTDRKIVLHNFFSWKGLVFETTESETLLFIWTRTLISEKDASTLAAKQTWNASLMRCFIFISKKKWFKVFIFNLSEFMVLCLCVQSRFYPKYWFTQIIRDLKAVADWLETLTSYFWFTLKICLIKCSMLSIKMNTDIRACEFSAQLKNQDGGKYTTIR